MGKNLIQQARGKGGPRYRAPSFNYKGKAELKDKNADKQIDGTVTDIIHCRGHSAPLISIKYSDGEQNLAIAPEGIAVGDKVTSAAMDIELGNTLQLGEIPEGTLIHNIESKPGDNGKFVRSSGTSARVLSKSRNTVTVLLPSKKRKEFSAKCRACVGIVAGGGRPEKPFVKAGTRYFHMKARNKLWPLTSASAMNAVDHPFGNKRTLRKSKAKPVSRNAPPGRKVGMIAARRTGRKKK